MPQFNAKDLSDSESDGSNNSDNNDNDNEDSEDNESDEQPNQDDEEEEVVDSGDPCNDDNDNRIRHKTCDGFTYIIDTVNNNNNNDKNKWTRNNGNARGNSSGRGKFNKKNRNNNNNQCGNSFVKKDSNWNNNNNNKQGNNNNNQGNKKNNKGNNNNNQGNKNNNNGNKNNNNNNNSKNKNKKKDEFQELWTSVRKFVFGKYSYHPLNSWMLKLHYRVAFIFFFIFFYVIAKYNWFATREITCVSGHNAEQPNEPFLENICLSYSYIEVEDAFGKSKKYVLFYRWIPYILAILSLLFYSPRSLMKCNINPRFLGFVKEIQQTSVRISVEGSDCIKDKTVLYFERNLATHKNMYYMFVFLHVLCVFISCGTFLFLDFVMQGEFWTLALTFPFSRDPKTFKDRLSESFPPFVTCIIKPPMNMINSASEVYHCHLLYNEFYEKLFVILWVLMVILIVAGLAYTSLLFLMSLTPFCKILFWTHLEFPKSKESKETIFNSLDVGDGFCLYVIKQIVSEAQFCRILDGLDVVLKKHANLLREKFTDEKYSKENVCETEMSLKSDSTNNYRTRLVDITELV